jgi:hypothetical protein
MKTTRTAFVMNWLAVYPNSSSWNRDFMEAWNKEFKGGMNAGTNLENHLRKMYKKGLLARGKAGGLYVYSVSNQEQK